MEIRKGMYSLPQARKIANNLLRKRLKPHGYFETSTLGLWKHKSRPVMFTLVVDKFGMKYVGPPHLHHLISILKNITPLKLTIKAHPQPKRSQHSPFLAPPKCYGKAAQIEEPSPISPLLPIAKQKCIQQIVGSLLFYCRGADSTITKALNSIGQQQNEATENTQDLAHWLLDY
eukprot:6604971-Ditylum_brightwellii.AAC.1